MARKMTDDATFAQMWADGVPIADIAAHFGVNPATVRRHRARIGARKRYILTREELAPLWNAGLPGPEIAERLGVHVNAVHCAARRYGLPSRTGAGLRKPAKKAAPTMLERLPEPLRPKFRALRDEMGLSEPEALRRLYAMEVRA